MASTLSVLGGVRFWRGLASKLGTLIKKLNFGKKLNFNEELGFGQTSCQNEESDRCSLIFGPKAA